MAESKKDEPDIKEVAVSIQEDILPSSTVEDTITIYVKEEDVKIEITEIKGKLAGKKSCSFQKCPKTSQSKVFSRKICKWNSST